MPLEDDKALTRSAIKLFHHRIRLPVPSLPIPTIIKTVENVSDLFSTTPKPPAQFQLYFTYKKFIAAMRYNQWDALNDRDWKYAPYIFWAGTEKLAGIDQFITKYFNWLKKQTIRSNWRRLIFIYLRDFNYRKEYPSLLKTMANAIQDAFKQPHLKFGLRLWENRHSNIGLFADSFDLSNSVNAFIVGANNDWGEFSELTGLTGELGLSGYADSVGLEILNRYEHSPTMALFKTIVSFHFSGQPLRFQNRRVSIIHALISPWNNTGYRDDALHKNVMELLLKHFKDPRFPNHRAQGWRYVDEYDIKIMCKWLFSENLNQFFAIIDEVANDHHWKYRKAFWKAYFDKDYFDEAWVAFGPDAMIHAQRLFGANFSAGKLENAGQSNQSVLLVKIKDLVLAEWSHNGKCHAWKSNDQYCPTVYQPIHFASHLKQHSMQIKDEYRYAGISHQRSENYHWQKLLAYFIYDETGIRIQESDFRVQ